ncbi:MAG: TAT-variant-translocated molybdopterin oxidoreductase [Bacteroidia bacterium]|jgi:molybdopterin-containing oxidoreductase family iron-sulfur binding subunit|nr:TAT-variant-translocated molybdopterin oxidoreductase [Bacteroidia bacterium]
MENKNKYWKGLEELNNDPKFLERKRNEFAEGIPLEEVLTEQDGELTSNRRDFLKYFGFSVSAVALAACNKAPVKQAIPYIVKPENVTPGIPNWYATTNPETGASLLVKTREGRPIKIEGNPESPVFKGGVSAIEHASLLGLYDNERLKAPNAEGNEVDWNTLDAKITSGLAGAKNIRLVTGTVNSPSTKRAIAEFTAKYPAAKHISYEPYSHAAIIDANRALFGKAVIPGYRFDKAKVIVSFGADFLGTWISPVEFTKQWASNRKVGTSGGGKKEMSRHIQFESNLSLTGSNADVRFPIKPSAEGALLVSLYNKIASLAGAAPLSGAQNLELALNMVELTAKELWEAKGSSLVVSGSNSIDNQALVCAINHLLGNIGQAYDLDNYSLQSTANDFGFQQFVREMNDGKIDAAVFVNTNPAYNYYNAAQFAAGLKKVGLTVCTNSSMDETAMLCKFHAPDNHYLESWGDAEPKAGYYALIQPTISPVFNTRQASESILRWAGNNTDYYTYVKATWSAMGVNEATWNKSLHDGFMYAGPKASQSYPIATAPTGAAAIAIQNYVSAKDKTELQVYAKVGIGDGTHANNPWLQELPDPISKVCWDNYASIGKVTADKLGVKDGDLVKIAGKNFSIESIPVLVQPGQANQTVSVAIGYGRTEGGKVAKYVGKNAYGFGWFEGDTFRYTQPDITIEKVAGSYELAQTQTHHTIEGRDIIREASLKEFVKDPKAGNHKHAHIISLWDERDSKGHRWAMAIDMNACTGCGACVVSCSAENNVPVVGRKEVLNSREMHWIRIDRYYSFKDKNGKTATRETGLAGNMLKGKEEGLITEDTNFEDVRVAFQPMMCQHCGHAPCETVCPVLATVHSSEGLNHMAYNRCVGTRYCANNCPYKVRRFNWFKYRENDKFDFYMNNDLGRMVINPDVTVRSRGVMEKCSFCIQRIQGGKLKAKLEGRSLKDGDVKTACQQSCPSDAIVFGDVNDPNSEIAKLFNNERSYVLLEEYNVQPSVSYMTKIRNVNEPIAGDHASEGAEHGAKEHQHESAHS